MLFNIIFKQYLNIFIRNFVLCIQIRFVSTEKTTRIASRASCFTKYMGAPSDQFLRLLYGAPQVSFFAYYMGSPQISFCAYFLGAPLRSVFFSYHMGPPRISFFTCYIGGPLRSVSSLVI